jgi:hypothetical protein
MSTNYKKNTKGNKKSYNKASFKKRNFKEDKVEDKRFEAKDPSNDPRWYSKFPQLVADTARIWFSKPTGYPQAPVHSGSNGGINCTPGIMTFDYVPMPGISVDASSPINTVARAAYVFQRYVNSGAKVYESSDLMMYFLAMDSCLTTWSIALRAYGIARYFSAVNRYRAPEILRSLGFDPSIADDLARFRAVINTYVAKLASYAVPGTMDYFRRHIAMSGSIYRDAMDEKSQLYAFRPAVYYVWDDQTDPQGSKLTAKSMPYMTEGVYMDINSIAAIMDEQFNKIVESEDCGIMTGDIVKSYKDDILQLTMIPDEFTILPVYDEMMLSQIENATLGANYELTDITQDVTNQIIRYDPTFGTSGYDGIIEYLNLHTDSPTPEEIMEASRLMVNYKFNGTQVVIESVGSEFIVGSNIWYYNSETNTLVSRVWGTISALTETNDAISKSDVASLLVTLDRVSKFRRHPRCLAAIASDGASIFYLNDWEVGNMAEIESNIDLMHQTALLSMFDTGRIALTK